MFRAHLRGRKAAVLPAQRTPRPRVDPWAELGLHPTVEPPPRAGWRLSFGLGITTATGWGLVAGNVLRERGAVLDQPVLEIFAVTNGAALTGAVFGATLFVAGSVLPFWVRYNDNRARPTRH